MKNRIVQTLPISKTNLKLQLSNAKAFLRYAKKIHKEIKEYHKIYKLDNTYQLCDGFTAIVLKNMIDGLELNQERYQYLDGRKFIDNCLNDYEKINVNIPYLKQKIRIAKKLECVKFENTINFKNSYFNPIYLLRAIHILGTENVTIYVHNSSYFKPAYLTSDLGEAIVLPIAPPKELRKY